MNILMLTPYLPYPLLSGGQIRTYNLLKNASSSHKITLFALIKDESETEHIKHLKPFCSKIKVFRRTKNPWAIRNVLLAGLTAYPFLITRNLPKGMKAAIAQELSNQEYDLIHAETFYMMPNIPKTRLPIMLVEQTIEYLGFQFYAQHTSHKLLKPLLYLDIAKIKYWEKYYWNRASHLVTMSDEDKTYISKSINRYDRIDVVANGVDVERFSLVKREKLDRPTVLFVGTFKWLPNIDAVEYLVAEIWPLIKKNVPEARLWIVGHSPTDKVLDFGRRVDIKVSSDVVDITTAYANAHVLLAPIRSGKGTRYKVLEAMATGTPVVTTPLGAEGLEITPGQDVLIGHNSQELANKTIKLLQNTKLQKTISNRAKTVVGQKYGWSVISKKLNELYRQIGGGEK